MNVQKGKVFIKVYNDEDIIMNQSTKENAAKPIVSKAAQPQAGEKLERRQALAVIASSTATSISYDENSSSLNYSIPTRDIVKPTNKFFRHERVEVTQRMEEEYPNRSDKNNTMFKPRTIWSPLTVESSGDPCGVSPMVLDKTLENDFILKESDNDKLSPIELNLVKEYSDEIYSLLLNLEVKLRPRANYMKRQPDINSSMRSIVVDWLVEVGSEYKLQTETLYLAISYLDKFLSAMSVVRSKLQLVATSALFIAAKYEEIFPPELKEFVYITDETYSKAQVLRMEQLILDVLGFDLAVPTSISFLDRLIALYYSKATSSEIQKTANLARYICELSLLDGDKFLYFLPSQIACASFSVAKLNMGQIIWNELLSDISGYELENFKECSDRLQHVFELAPTFSCKAIQDKYKSPKYNCVSLMTPATV